MENTPGMLYICATPIGNLEDITLRVLRVLREADEIWAEDTRHTLQLLNHFDIHKRLVSCHEHNALSRLEQLAATLRAGRSIAYCSDAGMPGISDPGIKLVEFCMESGLPVTVLPGASAMVLAAVRAGIPFHSLHFFGFLPREKKPRRSMLADMEREEGLLLLYESPVRLPATLRELAGILGGDRPAAVLRELTKLHEECARGTLQSLCERYPEPPRGECVIAIAGKPPADVSRAASEEDSQAMDAALTGLLREGLSTRDAATAVSMLLKVPKKQAYSRALALSDEGDE